jgi:hypothetical protein
VRNHHFPSKHLYCLAVYNGHGTSDFCLDRCESPASSLSFAADMLGTASFRLRPLASAVRPQVARCLVRGQLGMSKDRAVLLATFNRGTKPAMSCIQLNHYSTDHPLPLGMSTRSCSSPA